MHTQTHRHTANNLDLAGGLTGSERKCYCYAIQQRMPKQATKIANVCCDRLPAAPGATSPPSAPPPQLGHCLSHHPMPYTAERVVNKWYYHAIHAPINVMRTCFELLDHFQ